MILETVIEPDESAMPVNRKSQKNLGNIKYLTTDLISAGSAKNAMKKEIIGDTIGLPTREVIFRGNR